MSLSDRQVPVRRRLRAAGAPGVAPGDDRVVWTLVITVAGAGVLGLLGVPLKGAGEVTSRSALPRTKIA